MLEAALPRGKGQKKAVFEGLPGLAGPPEMPEEEVGSKTHKEERQSSTESFGSHGTLG